MKKSGLRPSNSLKKISEPEAGAAIPLRPKHLMPPVGEGVDLIVTRIARFHVEIPVAVVYTYNIF